MTNDHARATRLIGGVALAVLMTTLTAVGAFAASADHATARTGHAGEVSRHAAAKPATQRPPRTLPTTTIPTTTTTRALPPRGTPAPTPPPTTTTTTVPAPEPPDTTTTVPRRARGTTPPTTVATTTTAPPPPPTTTTTAPPPPTTTTSMPTGAPQMEQRFAALINDLRASVGLPALHVDSGLTSYARAWSEHMAATGEFAHSDIGSLLNPWHTVGENIAWGYSVDSMFSGLAGSPGHYANMTRPGYTHIGIGVVVDASGRIWTTHVFAG